MRENFGEIDCKSLHFLPHPRSPGGKPQRSTARVKIASAPVFPTIPQPRFAGGANFRFVCLSVCPSVRGARATSHPNLGAKAVLVAPSNAATQISPPRPKRLRCNSDPAAGAATPQTAPPTRAPAGRRLTDARHSRHARSRSHHGHRSALRPPSLLNHSRRLASCRAPRHCRLSTPPSSRDGGVE